MKYKPTGRCDTSICCSRGSLLWTPTIITHLPRVL